MRKFCVFVLTSAFLLWNCAVADVPFSFNTVVEKAMPAVVNISTTQKINKKRQGLDMDSADILRDFLEKQFGIAPYGNEDDGGQMRKAISLGSGFIVDSAGYIITNNHVVDDAEEVSVTLSGDNGQSYKAKIIGKDPKTDLAVLKIDSDVKLPFLKFGSSDKAKVGDFVVAIGNPFGLGGSVSAGIISAKARNINSGHYDDFIQTDAAINVGNSGGPMLNTDGEVIGVNSVILSPSRGNIGIGFAIPSGMVKYVFEQLKEKGKIIRGQLGITIQDIDKDLMDNLGLKGVRGALVSGVLRDSPADRAGIRIGDVVTRFNDKPITTYGQLPRMVGEVPLNSEAEIEIFRDGKSLKIKTIVEKAKDDDAVSSDEEEDGQQEISGVFGLQVQNITPKLVKKFGFKGQRRGVIVTGVARGSLAALVGIRSGDIILSVNKKDINTAKDFENATSNIKKNGKGSATLLVARGDSTFFVSLNNN